MVGNIKVHMSSKGDEVLQIHILQAAFFTKKPEMAQLTLN
jgi:hypothetical protein